MRAKHDVCRQTAARRVPAHRKARGVDGKVCSMLRRPCIRRKTVLVGRGTGIFRREAVVNEEHATLVRTYAPAFR